MDTAMDVETVNKPKLVHRTVGKNMKPKTASTIGAKSKVSDAFQLCHMDGFHSRLAFFLSGFIYYYYC